MGIAPPEKLTKKQRKLWDYMRLHPEVTEFSTIAKRTGLARNTVKKHYGMVAAMLGKGGRGESETAVINILDNTSAAEQIPKDARGRFITGDGTVFQGYLFGEGQL